MSFNVPGFGSGLPTGEGSGDPSQQGGDSTPPAQNPPDGHKYLIESSPNESGLNWFTVYEFDNAVDANSVYADVISSGYWRLLVDGAMTKTNIPEKKVEDTLRDVWNIEANVQGTWTFIAEAGTLAAAQALLASIRAGNYKASIPPQSDMRITDKNGAVVAEDKGKEPTPGEEADSYTDKDGKTHWKWKDGTWHDSPEGMYQWPDGSWQDTPYVPPTPGGTGSGTTPDVENSMNAIMVGVVVVLIIGLSAYMLQGAE